MPNAFTPNNDGHNDIFKVKYSEAIKTFRMNIFNRWGQLVFSSEDRLHGWDGNFKGAAQPTGTYVWMINYQDVLGNSKGLSGNIAATAILPKKYPPVPFWEYSGIRAFDPKKDSLNFRSARQ